MKNRFPVEPAPSECKKKWKIALNTQISRKKVKKCSFSILNRSKKLFESQKNFWWCKILFYISFKRQNFHKSRTFWYRPIFRPFRPIGRYVSCTHSYRHISLHKHSRVFKERLSFHLMGTASFYIAYWVIYVFIKFDFTFSPWFVQIVAYFSRKK